MYGDQQDVVKKWMCWKLGMKWVEPWWSLAI